MLPPRPRLDAGRAGVSGRDGGGEQTTRPHPAAVAAVQAHRRGARRRRRRRHVHHCGRQVRPSLDKVFRPAGGPHILAAVAACLTGPLHRAPGGILHPGARLRAAQGPNREALLRSEGGTRGKRERAEAASIGGTECARVSAQRAGTPARKRSGCLRRESATCQQPATQKRWQALHAAPSQPGRAAEGSARPAAAAPKPAMRTHWQARLLARL